MLAAGTSRKDTLRAQGLLAIVLIVSVKEVQVDNPAERLVSGLGGRALVAERFSISIESVRLWLENGIPADRALEVEEITRGTSYAIGAIDILRFRQKRRKAA